MKDFVEHAVAELGHLDFVIANAGIAPGFSDSVSKMAAYLDAVDIMLNGVYFTIEAALPALLNNPAGGAIVITSSVGGLKSISRSFSTRHHGAAGYTASKHGVVGLMRYYATTLAEKNIRVNSVHPTGVATEMVVNSHSERYANEHADFAAAMQNLLPVPLVEARDISKAMLYLCGESGRYITGVALPVDAGQLLK
jgi:NAD(P)-dependent dehydrogenase (short-subunit alcohol dehydrogenase family)